MDNDQQVQVIEARLDAPDGMPVSDDQSAREVFTQVMVTVSRISQLSGRARAHRSELHGSCMATERDCARPSCARNRYPGSGMRGWCHRGGTAYDERTPREKVTAAVA